MRIISGSKDIRDVRSFRTITVVRVIRVARKAPVRLLLLPGELSIVVSISVICP